MLRRKGMTCGGKNLCRGSNEARQPRLKRQAQLSGRENCIISAAKDNIAPDAAKMRQIKLKSGLFNIGRHAFKGCAGDMALIKRDLNLHQPAGQFEAEFRACAVMRHLPAVHGPAANGDCGMAAHGGIARSMAEQSGNIRARKAGAHRNHPIHAGMAARFMHQQGAQMVIMRKRITALVENGCALKLRITFAENTHRLTGCVHINHMKNR